MPPSQGEMTMPKRVLFISHDATRTGAPMILLHLLRWLRANTELSFDVLLRDGGELAGEFEQTAQVFYFNGPRPNGLVRKAFRAILALQASQV